MPDDQQTSPAHPPAAATAGDLVAAVAAEHGRFRTIFERLQVGTPSEEEMREFTRAAVQHAVFHSEVLASYADTDEVRDEVRARLIEDEGMAQQIQQLEGMDVGSPTFSIQLGLFGDALEHHLNAQLSQETPILAERMSAEQRALVVSVLAQGPDTGAAEAYAEMAAAARADARRRWLT